MSSQAPSPPSELVCVIKPDSGSWLPNFRELWRYRELFWALAMKDITARYKQTYLGFLWAIIMPVAQVMIFNVLFSLIGIKDKLAGSGTPYLLTALCANMAWMVFSGGANAVSGSIGGNAGMIKKVYFPRLLLPLSALARSLVDFAIMLGVLFVAILAYRWFAGYDCIPTWRLLFLPLFVGVAVLFAFGLGIWIAAITARWRDVGFLVPFAFQLMQYASPIIYETNAIVPEKLGGNGAKWLADRGVGQGIIQWIQGLDLRAIYGLNPMAGVIEGFRWSVFGEGHGQAPGPMMLVSVLVILFILVSGLWYFKRAERNFVDIL